MIKNGFLRFCDDPELACCRAERDKAVELISKLVLLCDQPKEWRDKVFRRHANRPGDYMGCGYDFLDAFYRMWDDFSETADDDFYRAVRNKIEEHMAARGTEGKA